MSQPQDPKHPEQILAELAAADKGETRFKVSWATMSPYGSGAGVLDPDRSWGDRWVVLPRSKKVGQALAQSSVPDEPSELVLHSQRLRILDGQLFLGDLAMLDCSAETFQDLDAWLQTDASEARERWLSTMDDMHRVGNELKLYVFATGNSFHVYTNASTLEKIRERNQEPFRKYLAACLSLPEEIADHGWLRCSLARGSMRLRWTALTREKKQRPALVETYTACQVPTPLPGLPDHTSWRVFREEEFEAKRPELFPQVRPLGFETAPMSAGPPSDSDDVPF